MAMKKTYTCDICKERVDNPDNFNIFGVRFHSGNERFTLGGYGATDGSHICIKCAKELKRQLNKPEIEKIMTSH